MHEFDRTDVLGERNIPIERTFLRNGRSIAAKPGQRIVLKNHAHMAVLHRKIGRILAVEEDPAAIGRIEARDDAQQRRLAGARGSEQRDEFARLNVERLTSRKAGKAPKSCATSSMRMEVPRLLASVAASASGERVGVTPRKHAP